MSDEQRPEPTTDDAYARYVALQWRLIRVPPADPARPALAAAVIAADRHWRALSGVPDLRSYRLFAR